MRFRERCANTSNEANEPSDSPRFGEQDWQATMAEFQAVCKTSEISDPGKEIFEVEDQLVVVFHVEGKFYCIDDVCTHDGGPLSDGNLDGCQIACPRHGARFDITNGAALTMPATEGTRAHEVKIEGEQVLVKLAPED